MLMILDICCKELNLCCKCVSTSLVPLFRMLLCVASVCCMKIFEFNKWDLFAYSEYLSNLVRIAMGSVATTFYTHAKRVACGDLCCMDRVLQDHNLTRAEATD